MIYFREHKETFFTCLFDCVTRRWMYTRDYKTDAPGSFFHVYNRGNAKGDVFLDEQDYRFFLLRLSQNLLPYTSKNRFFRPLPAGAFSLVAYCLMPNHFHMLIGQNRDISTSKLLGKVCTSYAMYFNKKYERTGHVFQDRFKQITVDSNKYLLTLSAYIHNNPVKAKLIDRPKDWRWSSYQEFIQTGTSDGFCDPSVVTRQFGDSHEYEKFMAAACLEKETRMPEELLLDHKNKHVKGGP